MIEIVISWGCNIPPRNAWIILYYSWIKAHFRKHFYDVCDLQRLSWRTFCSQVELNRPIRVLFSLDPLEDFIFLWSDTHKFSNECMIFHKLLGFFKAIVHNHKFRVLSGFGEALASNSRLLACHCVPIMGEYLDICSPMFEFDTWLFTLPTPLTAYCMRRALHSHLRWPLLVG